MRYAFMTFSTPSLSLDEVLQAAVQYGYDGIEPRIDEKHKHGIEVAATRAERDAARKKAADAGIALACLATSLRYADPANKAQAVKDTHERIDLAGDMRMPAMRVFGGAIPEGITREEAMNALVEALGAVADHAAERGVTLCIETHDDWCDPAHVAEVLRRINHPAIAANWDIMHPIRRGNVTMDQAFEMLKPWIRHLHVHDCDADGKLLPIGQGIIDHRAALARVKSVDYADYISGEWIGWEPYDVHLPRELAAMKQIESELG